MKEKQDKQYRYNNHSVTRLTTHIVWVTKYRYHVLKGDIQKRAREIIIQLALLHNPTHFL